MNLSENGEQGNKVKAKEDEIWNSRRFLFSNVYASDLLRKSITLPKRKQL